MKFNDLMYETGFKMHIVWLGLVPNIKLTTNITQMVVLVVDLERTGDNSLPSRVLFLFP